MALTRPVVPPVGSFLFGHRFDFSADKSGGNCRSAAMRMHRLTGECCRKARIDGDFLRRTLQARIACWTTGRFSTEYPCHN